MIKTAITEMFGIDYPIICGAMMWVSKPRLCAAISNGGGMGNITAAIYDTEEAFRNAVRETKRLTHKPFAVNVTIFPSVRITPEHHKMYLRVCAEERVAALEISGTPLDRAMGMETVEMLKDAGVKLFHKVGSVRHALHAEKAGYDGIYAAGIEEGGAPLGRRRNHHGADPENCGVHGSSRGGRRRDRQWPEHGGGLHARGSGCHDGQPVHGNPGKRRARRRKTGTGPAPGTGYHAHLQVHQASGAGPSRTAWSTRSWKWKIGGAD